MLGSDRGGWRKITSLPRRGSQRLIHDTRHDIRGAKRKAAAVIPPAVLFFVEKWLGFWTAVIASALTVGGLGMGLVYLARWASTVSVLVTTILWFIKVVGIVGFLTILTWGVILFAIVLVSGLRLILWIQNTFRRFWNQHTPPFWEHRPEDESTTWPATDEDCKTAWKEMRDYLGWGSIIFVSILTIMLYAENTAEKDLYGILSSPYLTAIGSSIDAGFQFVDFDGFINTVAPNATQPQLLFFILFFVIPGGVAAIGARNLLFLTESQVRERIETVQEDGFICSSTVYLAIWFIWSTGVCIQLLNQWG